jgi:hypothetical protein
VIVTQDVDFLNLASQGLNHPGIIYTSQHSPIRKIISGLMLIYEVLDVEDMRDHIEFI